MATPPRDDLAALLTPLVRSLTAAERPVLAAHEISMWGYVVLGALSDNVIRSQAALAELIGADKTRIISTLDELQQAGLITREPDPADRRTRLLALTAAGRRKHAAVQTDIQRNEDQVLATLPATVRQGFLRALQILSTLSPADIANG
jgi:DNA-binding MarR family transcriptional regulator